MKTARHTVALVGRCGVHRDGGTGGIWIVKMPRFYGLTEATTIQFRLVVAAATGTRLETLKYGPMVACTTVRTMNMFRFDVIDGPRHCRTRHRQINRKWS